MVDKLTSLTAGMAIVYGGDRFTTVSEQLAVHFVAGDHLVVVQATGDLLHIPAAEHRLASEAVAAAGAAFAELGGVDDQQISAFFNAFAARLEDDACFADVAAANAADVAVAAANRRSTTRLELTPTMRSDMIAGLRIWADQPGGRDELLRTIEHQGWLVEERAAPLGVVGFVFEGRPNVFADAAGVLRSGNTVVFRIGSDALGTARAIMAAAVQPALALAGLPAAAVVLLDSQARAAGWALFAERGLALAVARGSGQAVAQLGAVARQTGIPVSLHGTGGSWLIAADSADVDRFRSAVLHSLDRKVCNTMNVCCIAEGRAGDLVPVFLEALDAAAAKRSTFPRLHVAAGSESALPDSVWARRVNIARAQGSNEEPFADTVAVEQLGTEWEWEASPEVSLVIVDTVGEAVRLFNRFSPRFGASLIAESAEEQDAFWATIDAPFVGDGFTRWVDGQYALDLPELGLSNWQSGRLLARSGILSGNSVRTVRLRVRQNDPSVHR